MKLFLINIICTIIFPFYAFLNPDNYYKNNVLIAQIHLKMVDWKAGINENLLIYIGTNKINEFLNEKAVKAEFKKLKKNKLLSHWKYKLLKQSLINSDYVNFVDSDYIINGREKTDNIEESILIFDNYKGEMFILGMVYPNCISILSINLSNINYNDNIKDWIEYCKNKYRITDVYLNGNLIEDNQEVTYEKKINNNFANRYSSIGLNYGGLDWDKHLQGKE